MKYFLLIACLAFSASTWARLGETEEKCDERYDHPAAEAGAEKTKETGLKKEAKKTKSTAILSQQKDGSILKDYRNGDQRVVARFVSKKCVELYFVELPKDLWDAVLKANAGKSSWVPSPMEKDKWEREDKSAIAWYNGSMRIEGVGGSYYAYFVLQDAAYAKAIEGKKAAEQKNSAARY